MSNAAPLIIYHGNCPDGFCAAWVTHRALEQRMLLEPELFPGMYGEEPPYELAKGRRVVIVDFSYPREQLIKLNAVAELLTVLDHHKTSQADLEGLPYCVFDMSRSGAGLAWDYYHPTKPRPWIVRYVEDRDLWKFELPHSHEISLRIRLAPHTLEAYDALSARSEEEILPEAKGAKLHLDHYVRDATRVAYDMPNLFGDGENVRCVNITYTGISDVLNQLLEAGDVWVALGWQRNETGLVTCSLRSAKSFDCSVYAKQMKGGGHPQASGFRVPCDSDFARRLLLGELTPPSDNQ